MIMKFIALLRRMDVQFYVAPYEADAQLAFLSKAKLIDVVVSEDADCVPYGCRTVDHHCHHTGLTAAVSRLMEMAPLLAHADPLQARLGRLGLRAQAQKPRR
jgi:5'-3' exonuclease